MIKISTKKPDRLSIPESKILSKLIIYVNKLNYNVKLQPTEQIRRLLEYIYIYSRSLLICSLDFNCHLTL